VQYDTSTIYYLPGKIKNGPLILNSIKLHNLFILASSTPYTTIGTIHIYNCQLRQCNTHNFNTHTFLSGQHSLCLSRRTLVLRSI